MECATIGYDIIARSGIVVKLIFHQIWIMMEKLLWVISHYKWNVSQMMYVCVTIE